MTARYDDRLDPERPEPLVPALEPAWDRLSLLAYPLVRVTAGAMLVPHGWMKLFGGGLEGTAGFIGGLGLGPGYPMALFIAILEFVGGLMLVAGLLTRPVAALVVVFMAVAAFYVHWGNGFLWTNGGYEYPLFWGLVALALVFGGGGRYSLDRLIGKEI